MDRWPSDTHRAWGGKSILPNQLQAVAVKSKALQYSLES